MNMRSLTFFGAVVTALTVAAVSNLAACGNGTGGSGAAGGAGGSASNGTGTGGSPACSASCAAAITNGDLVCGMTSAEQDYVALHNCGDMSCATECMGQFDSGMGLDMACGACLTTHCKTEQDTCNNN